MHQQPKNIGIKIAVFGAIALLSSSVVLADQVQGLTTFQSGNQALASEVNDNFSEVETSVNDNDTRINTNASDIADNFSDITSNSADIANNFVSLDQRISNIETPDFSNYATPFSNLGDPKNVTVQVSENGDLTKSYYIRSRYRNDSEEVQVNGVITTPPLIANYGFVQVDTIGDVTFIGTYIEAPATEAYLNYTAEDSTLDLVTFAKTIIDDSWSESWTCNGGGAISTCNWIGSVNGVATQNNTWVSVYSQLGAATINGITLPDLRMEVNTYTDGVRHRVRARGIGEVLRLVEGGRPRVLIYYRVDGATGGSLAGTPFEVGGVLVGVLF